MTTPPAAPPPAALPYAAPLPAAPPYAAPLAAVDELLITRSPDGGLELRVTKDVRATDRYLSAHFPGQVIYPGVFILETVRQAVLAALGDRDGVLPDLSEVCSMRFHSALRPGERLTVAVAVAVPGATGAFAVHASCRSGPARVATLLLEFRYEADGHD